MSKKQNKNANAARKSNADEPQPLVSNLSRPVIVASLCAFVVGLALLIAAQLQGTAFGTGALFAYVLRSTGIALILLVFFAVLVYVTYRRRKAGPQKGEDEKRHKGNVQATATFAAVVLFLFCFFGVRPLALAAMDYSEGSTTEGCTLNEVRSSYSLSSAPDYDLSYTASDGTERTVRLAVKEVERLQDQLFAAGYDEVANVKCQITYYAHTGIIEHIDF